MNTTIRPFPFFYKFIDFVMDAQITADITNYVWYANANTASLPLVLVTSRTCRRASGSS